VLLGWGACQAEGTAGEQRPKEKRSRSSEDQKQATAAGIGEACLDRPSGQN